MGEARRNLCLPVTASTEDGHMHVVFLWQLEDLKGKTALPLLFGKQETLVQR